MASIDQSTDVRRPPATSRPKRWAFCLAAIVVGLAPLVAFEGACRLIGRGRPAVHDDPFVGFRSVLPLFVESDDGARYEIPKARQVYFAADSFAAEKPAGGLRIFCLGGSTVQGRPFTLATAFSTWLELSLQAAEPDRPIEVINCGGVSYASYRLVPILEEVLAYQPDLIVLYTGHNEFLEQRAYAHVAARGPVVNAALRAASHLRTFTLLREGYLRMQGRSSDDPPEGRPLLPTEVDALLDYRGGLAEYHRDEELRAGAIDHYAFNLRRMVRMAGEAGVPLVLVNPVSNFCDSPPFKCEHRADLTPEERSAWQAACDEASARLHGDARDLQAAIERYDEACRIDPLHAEAFYNLGKCLQAAGQLDEAREAFRQAKELDVCPLRIVQPMNDAVLAIAAENDLPLVDAQALFEQRSADGIAGGEWLLDHVHPSIEGHQLLADALAEVVVARGLVRPGDDWQSRKLERYAAHFDALESHYFLKGQEQLRSLRNWAQGRAKRARGPSGKPGN